MATNEEVALDLKVGISHLLLGEAVATEVVKVDSKGRVLIPEQIRGAAKIDSGAPLQVVNLGGGVLVLRKIELPSKEEILKICREVRREVYKGEVEPWLKDVLKRKKARR